MTVIKKIIFKPSVYLFVLSLFFSAKVSGLNDNDSLFNIVFYNAATTLSATNMNQAIVVADSLLKNAQNNTQKIKSLMLLATLNERKGEIAHALAHAIKAQELADADKNKNWQLRISGFLSTTFRGIGLNENGLKYLQIAEKTLGNDDSPNMRSMIYQEKAYYDIAAKKYANAIENLKQSEIQIEKIPAEQRISVVLATTYQLLGECHLELNNHRFASEYFRKSLKELGNEESELKGFDYLGLGRIEIHNKQHDSAYKFFKMAKDYADRSNNFSLQTETYKNLALYFKITKDDAKAVEYGEKYRVLLEAQSNLTSSVSNQLIRQFNIESKESDTAFNYLGMFTIFFLVVFALYLFYSIKKRKTLKQKFDEGISKMKEVAILNNKEAIVAKVDPPVKETDASSNRVSQLMPVETEERLLKELSKMEKKNFFTQKEISISALAVMLQTNQKYLSYLINHHKGKDFNNYISELRIYYIIKKLQEDKNFLNYKIAYLADESGFSSHSKFTAAFKSIIGLSPSEFISQLKKSEQQSLLTA